MGGAKQHNCKSKKVQCIWEGIREINNFEATVSDILFTILARIIGDLHFVS
jgi:hypothetical protein